ncbi:MAG TPA: protease inhibitor I42 family protein [Planctomycetota bacterium]|nr:protease inhibitor I42 family protein [Planctomycetota bacterium]
MMMIRRLGTGVLLLLAALGSCKPPSSPPPYPVYREPATTIKARVGDEFGIEVSYNPTVAPAYRLELKHPVPDCLSELGTDETSDAGGERKPGSGGTRIHRFRAVRPGLGTVTLSAGSKGDELGRPEPLTFSVTVTGP